MPRKPKKRPAKSACEWISRTEAFKRFATHRGGTESAKHIKPLHWYIACRLVLEGGFHPDWVTPRPPFHVERKGNANLLVFHPESAGSGEQAILGGLKTKNVDVVVTLPRVGPVIAVSCKGVTKAFRNLTNRMEETIGECTNLHITYAAMVVGYFVLLRANRSVRDAVEAPKMDEDADDIPEEGDASDQDDKGDAGEAVEQTAVPTPGTELSSETVAEITANDIAILENENVAEGVKRFHDALCQMTLRHGVREDIARYEAMTMAIVEPKGDVAGSVFPGYPSLESPLRLEKFFRTIYQRYEERFVFGAPLLADRGITARLFWSPRSPVIERVGLEASGWPPLDFNPRVADK
jgi:hypothetical protein